MATDGVLTLDHACGSVSDRRGRAGSAREKHARDASRRGDDAHAHSVLNPGATHHVRAGHCITVWADSAPALCRFR
eukprot:3932435-Rhodomonas_salina.3